MNRKECAAAARMGCGIHICIEASMEFEWRVVKKEVGSISKPDSIGCNSESKAQGKEKIFIRNQ